MLSLMRLTAIALSLLVFAVVLSICGEAVACEGCVHSCCVRSDQVDRRRQAIVARISSALSSVVRALSPASSPSVALGMAGSPSSPSLSLLVAQAAPLRI